ncbi:hypothetical protein FRX31_030630, partial [Thalictrum thalictroides]
MQMLKDQGYLVTDYELKMTKQDFHDKHGHATREDLVTSKCKQNDNSDHFSLYCWINDLTPFARNCIVKSLKNSIWKFFRDIGSQGLKGYISDQISLLQNL